MTGSRIGTVKSKGEESPVQLVGDSSEGQEKYLRELSITPVGYFTGSYKKSLPCGVPQELFCMAKMRYFRGTGMIFPRLALL
jgi:hypothetical protein